MNMSANLVLKTIDTIIDESIDLKEQPSDIASLKPAPKYLKKIAKLTGN